jgi:hypothetical protein
MRASLDPRCTLWEKGIVSKLTNPLREAPALTEQFLSSAAMVD